MAKRGDPILTADQVHTLLLCRLHLSTRHSESCDPFLISLRLFSLFYRAWKRERGVLLRCNCRIGGIFSLVTASLIEWEALDFLLRLGFAFFCL